MTELVEFRNKDQDEWVIVDNTVDDAPKFIEDESTVTIERLAYMATKIQSTWRGNRCRFVEKVLATQFDDVNFPRRFNVRGPHWRRYALPTEWMMRCLARHECDPFVCV